MVVKSPDGVTDKYYVPNNLSLCVFSLTLQLIVISREIIISQDC